MRTWKLAATAPYDLEILGKYILGNTEEIVIVYNDLQNSSNIFILFNVVNYRECVNLVGESDDLTLDLAIPYVWTNRNTWKEQFRHWNSSRTKNQYRIPKHSAMALFGFCTPSSRQLLFGKNFTARNACAAISINMTEHDSCNSENSEVNHPSNYKYIIHNGYILYIYTYYLSIYYLSICIYIYTQSL